MGAGGKDTDRSGLEGKVVTLTDLNFDELVTSSGAVWMVDIYASWCPACKEMEPAWRQLAEELHKDGIRVHHFPSVYHISGSDTREYEGKRSLKAMAAFARGGWRSAEPRRGCSSPVSTCGRVFGEFTKVPAKFKSNFQYLHDKRGWGELSLFLGALAVPVAVGLLCICALDIYTTRQRVPAAAAAPHPHHD
eukprot:scaffold6.g2883.t1